MFPGESLVSKRRIRGLRCNRIFGSVPIMFLLFLASCAIVWFKQNVLGAVAFVVLATVELLLCSDLSVIGYPLLLLSCFVTPCYDSFSTFIRFWWIAPFFLAALVYNIIVFREKIRIGRTFIGLIAVAIAFLLAGTGYISRENLLSPVSLYYVLMLGPGMVLIYLLLRGRFAKFNIYGIFGRISLAMYLLGLLACFIIFCYTIQDNPDRENGFWLAALRNLFFSEFRASNNLSTFLMLAMPFPLWYALKQHPFHILSCFLFFIAIIVGGSRAGLILGAAELFLIYLTWMRYCGPLVKRAASFFGPLVVLIGLISVTWFIPHSRGFEIVLPKEFRIQAIEIAIENFREHTLFGIGLKSDVLNEIYQPKKGALCWFHMYFPQIMASMGLVGLSCFLFQLILRFSLFLRKHGGPVRWTLALSYLGLFLMSQVNPGEFCPLPYELMAVAIFVMLEQLTETEKLARLLAPEWGE